MGRAVIIIGNGMGMALDPEYFSLSYAMNHVWETPDSISDNLKRLIMKCLQAQGSVAKSPMSEKDLVFLQLAVAACEFLHLVAKSENAWLTREGIKFPSETRKYLTKVAWHFHHYSRELPITFSEPLCRFIKKTNSHVATLNYDNLLYQRMIEAKILCGYDGCLVDGFYADGFEDENMERKFYRDFGYYLHLHGSPLFIDKGDRIIKQTQAEAQEIPTKHLVLSDGKYKSTLIDASRVLSTYWRYLGLALQESETIYVFGYSGNDKHLNHLIESQVMGKEVRIIEWDGTGNYDTRIEFWKNEFHPDKEIQLIQLPNILNFTDWD